MTFSEFMSRFDLFSMRVLSDEEFEKQEKKEKAVSDFIGLIGMAFFIVPYPVYYYLLDTYRNRVDSIDHKGVF